MAGDFKFFLVFKTFSVNLAWLSVIRIDGLKIVPTKDFQSAAT